jgi:hypothetical protein
MIDVLSLAASFDQRTVGETDVVAWMAVATECGWTFSLACRAVLEHYKHQRTRVMPADVNAILTEARRQAVAAIDTSDLRPPVELRDDPRAEVAWIQATHRQLVGQRLNTWAGDCSEFASTAIEGAR